jgi:hypothetical protein
VGVRKVAGHKGAETKGKGETGMSFKRKGKTVRSACAVLSKADAGLKKEAEEKRLKKRG